MSEVYLQVPDDYVYTTPPYVPDANSLSNGTELAEWIVYCQENGWDCELPAGTIRIDQEQQLHDLSNMMIYGRGTNEYNDNGSVYDANNKGTVILIDDQYTQTQYDDAQNNEITLNYWNAFNIHNCQNLCFKNLTIRRDNGPVFYLDPQLEHNTVKFVDCSMFGAGQRFIDDTTNDLISSIACHRCSFNGLTSGFLDSNLIQYSTAKSATYRFFDCNFRNFSVLEDFDAGGGNSLFFGCIGTNVATVAKVNNSNSTLQPMIECYSCIWANDSGNDTILVDGWDATSFVKLCAIFSGGRVDSYGTDPISLIRVLDGTTKDVVTQAVNVNGNASVLTPFTTSEWADYGTLI